MILEVCVDSLESAVIAANSGADRIELCEDLTVGGLTPSAELVKDVKEFVKIPVFVLIRPRAGNFIYSDIEREMMLISIHSLKKLGVDGLVFGALNKKQIVDKKFCKQLIAAADGVPTTFHRAFDDTADKATALEDIIELGFQRILTTGGSATAEDGLMDLQYLIAKAGTRITIMPGGGVTDRNIEKIISVTNAMEVHSSGRTSDERSIKSIICSVKTIHRISIALEKEERRRMLKNAAM